MAALSGVLPAPPRFAPHHPDDSCSLRSVRGPLASSSASTSSAPSLKAASLRVRGALAVAHLLGSRGRPAFAPPDEPRLADLTHPSDFPSKSPPSKMAHPPKNSTPPQHPPLSPTPPPQATPANSKPRAIIRMLTTKFTPRSSPNPTPHPRRGPTLPPSPPNAFTAERRAAALRERGLLPPLPARDLSAQEMAQDMRIPIVSGSTGGDEGAVSAADLIKREWEAKNSAVDTPSTAESGTSDEGDVPPAPPAKTPPPTPTPGVVDTEPVDGEALNRERMRGFRFGGASRPPSPNPGVTSQHQHQEGHADVDKPRPTESTADPDAQEVDGHDMPRPLPVPPPQAPSPSSAPSALALSAPPPSVALSPPTPISPPGTSHPTSASQFTSTAPLSPPPTDALPPLPPSPSLPPPSSEPRSRSSTLSRPLPSPPTTPARQIHPDLQAFTFPALPPSPAPSAPAFVLSLSEAAGRASEDSLSSSVLGEPLNGMEAWAAALPPIPPSPAPSVRSALSVRSTRSAQGLRGAPLPMPATPPPPAPLSPTLAQVQAVPLSPSLVPLPSSPAPAPPAIALTPPLGAYLADAGHARDDSFALLAASMGISGGGGRTSEESVRSSGSGASEGLSSRAANGARALQFSASASLSASAPASAPEAPLLSSSASSPPAAPSSPTTPTRGLIPKGKLGALTVQTRAAPPAVEAPVLVLVESPGSRWSEELAVLIEEHEVGEGGLGGLSGSGKRSPAGSVTPTPSLGTTTVGGGGTTPTSTVNTAATAINEVFGPKSTKRTSEDSRSASEEDAGNPAQYVYARPAGAAAPFVASPVSSAHSHSSSKASSSSSSSAAAAAAAASSSLGAPLTPSTRAAHIPLPPTPTTPSIRVSSPTTSTSKRTTQKRGVTDPAEKKKSGFNPFKRSASALATSGGGGDGPTRRLSVAASLSHLRRSITASASTPHSSNGASGGRRFDASHLPPSPTPHAQSGFPSAAAVGSGGGGGANGRVVRQAVAPVVYSQGRILAEASAIEDEETRRMTELAFM